MMCGPRRYGGLRRLRNDGSEAVKLMEFVAA